MEVGIIKSTKTFLPFMLILTFLKPCSSLEFPFSINYSNSPPSIFSYNDSNSATASRDSRSQHTSSDESPQHPFTSPPPTTLFNSFLQLSYGPTPALRPLPPGYTNYVRKLWTKVDPSLNLEAGWNVRSSGHGHRDSPSISHRSSDLFHWSGVESVGKPPPPRAPSEGEGEDESDVTRSLKQKGLEIARGTLELLQSLLNGAGQMKKAKPYNNLRISPVSWIILALLMLHGVLRIWNLPVFMALTQFGPFPGVFQANSRMFQHQSIFNPGISSLI